MGATTQKNIFDSLYNPFGKDYRGNALFSWDYYIENYAGRQYYITVDLTPKMPVDRIPYYTSVTSWKSDYPSAGAATGMLAAAMNVLNGRNHAGFLPASQSVFYYKMRSVEIGGNKQAWLTAATATGLRKVWNKLSASFNSITGNSSNVLKETPVGAYLTIFTSKGYQNVLVPLNSKYFDFTFKIYDSEIMEDVKAQVNEQNILLRTYALTVEKQYNRVLKLQNNIRWTTLDLGAKSTLALLGQVFAGRITSLQNGDGYLAKVCTDCDKNARIGVIPFVYIIVALALGFGAWETDKWLTHKKYLQEQQQQIDREKAALDKMEEAMLNPNLTDIQKEMLVKAAAGVANSSKSIIEKEAANNNVGFFDRIENLLFLVGGFLILNNVTKKS